MLVDSIQVHIDHHSHLYRYNTVLHLHFHFFSPLKCLSQSYKEVACIYQMSKNHTAGVLSGLKPVAAFPVKYISLKCFCQLSYEEYLKRLLTQSNKNFRGDYWLLEISQFKMILFLAPRDVGSLH